MEAAVAAGRLVLLLHVAVAAYHHRQLAAEAASLAAFLHSPVIELVKGCQQCVLLLLLLLCRKCMWPGVVLGWPHQLLQLVHQSLVPLVHVVQQTSLCPHHVVQDVPRKHLHADKLWQPHFGFQERQLGPHKVCQVDHHQLWLWLWLHVTKLKPGAWGSGI